MADLVFTFELLIQDETETISDSEEEVDENNNKMQANSTGLLISNTYSYVDLTEEDPGVDEEKMKTNSPYDDTKDLLKLLNNENVEKSTNFKPDSELSTYDLNDFPCILADFMLYVYNFLFI